MLAQAVRLACQLLYRKLVVAQVPKSKVFVPPFFFLYFLFVGCPTKRALSGFTMLE